MARAKGKNRNKGKEQPALGQHTETEPQRPFKEFFATPLDGENDTLWAAHMRKMLNETEVPPEDPVLNYINQLNDIETPLSQNKPEEEDRPWVVSLSGSEESSSDDFSLNDPLDGIPDVDWSRHDNLPSWSPEPSLASEDLTEPDPFIRSLKRVVEMTKKQVPQAEFKQDEAWYKMMKEKYEGKPRPTMEHCWDSGPFLTDFNEKVLGAYKRSRLQVAKEFNDATQEIQSSGPEEEDLHTAGKKTKAMPLKPTMTMTQKVATVKQAKAKKRREKIESRKAATESTQLQTRRSRLEEIRRERTNARNPGFTMIWLQDILDNVDTWARRNTPLLRIIKRFGYESTFSYTRTLAPHCWVEVEAGYTTILGQRHNSQDEVDETLSSLRLNIMRHVEDVAKELKELGKPYPVHFTWYIRRAEYIKAQSYELSAWVQVIQAQKSQADTGHTLTAGQPLMDLARAANRPQGNPRLEEILDGNENGSEGADIRDDKKTPGEVKEDEKDKSDMEEGRSVVKWSPPPANLMRMEEFQARFQETLSLLAASNEKKDSESDSKPAKENGGDDDGNGCQPS